MSTVDDDHVSARVSSDDEGTGCPETGHDAPDSDVDAKQSGAWIRYSVEWRNLDNSFKSRQELDEKDADVQSFLEHSSTRRPAMERVSIFWTKHDRERAFEEANAEVKAMAATGATPAVYLHIYSVAIIHALRSVIEYYPQQDISGDVISVPWPYPVLVHHYDELQDFMQECAQREPSKACAREKHVEKHVRLLLDFLDKEVMDNVRAEKERNKRGYYTFDWLWVSHRPGTTLLSEKADGLGWQPGVVHSMSGGIFARPRTDWFIQRWCLMFDGEYLDRVLIKEWKSKFDGELRLVKIKILGHFEFLDEDVLEDELVKDQVEYGKMFFNMMSSQTKHHEGETMAFPRNEVQGTVRVDMKSYYAEGRKLPTFMNKSDLRDFTSDCQCRVCISKDSTEVDTSPTFDKYTFITRDRTGIYDHQYFLCPNEIYAFVFKTRTWELVHVKNLSAPRFQRDMIDNLVMEEKRRMTLTSLTASFARLDVHGKQLFEEPWAADFVGGKGNGLIFLLHGGPGVGKTFTAECIANVLQRPLMVLTVSDIGTNPTVVEKNLIAKFKTAKSWDAVLLIDEADVFLAQRSIEDLQRSSLVASFLRALEFYDGILFLTTNRVGTFDDAILSRVHIQLFYPDLDRDQRHKVWMNFVKKLEKDRPSMQVKYAVKEYLRSAEMSNLQMNGREIRNAFQTAVALAEHRAEQGDGGKTLVTEDHLREVIELHRSFKMYFDTLHGSEGRRALDRGERLEKFIKAIEEHF